MSTLFPQSLDAQRVLFGDSHESAASRHGARETLREIGSRVSACVDDLRQHAPKTEVSSRHRQRRHAQAVGMSTIYTITLVSCSIVGGAVKYLRL